MTTKRELERLARKALGSGAKVSCDWRSAQTWLSGAHVAVSFGDDHRKALAAALRGIIAWKEGKE